MYPSEYTANQSHKKTDGRFVVTQSRFCICISLLFFAALFGVRSPYKYTKIKKYLLPQTFGRIFWFTKLLLVLCPETDELPGLLWGPCKQEGMCGL